MKIAIQGHLTKGKEVIQILESLGGINTCNYSGNNFGAYYELHGNSIVCMTTKSDNIKYYTIEEFEKEFPFKIGNEVIFPVKIGWASGKVTGLTHVEDQLKYEVYARIGGFHYIEPHKLQLYPMKEERNVTLTLTKAKKWYKKGGDLKEIALQAFTEQELNPLPRSWEEFCEKYPIKRGECILESRDRITVAPCNFTGTRIYKNWIPSKQSAEAYLAMMQLEQLRDCWWGDWKPNWLNGNEKKYAIKVWRDKSSIEVTYVTHAFLSFPTYEMAKEFLECFKDLIEKAGDLI